MKFAKPRFLLVYPLVAWLVLVANTTEFQLRVGISLALLGVLLRIWANGYVGHVKVNRTQQWRGDAKIGRLITAGPYAFVRHPLYLGSFLIGAGFCVIVGDLWFSLAALAFFLIVYRRKMAEEERLLFGELGDEVATYQRMVPRWLPTGRRYPYRSGQWSWQGIRASKELKTVVWVVVLLILLYFREEFWQEHEFFAHSKWWYHATLLGITAVLIAADGAFELLKRRAKRAK